ncbi:NUDIX domain protein [uncultured archaeon]|nr:NUDIX domain protein [uncultured archaeon]
MESGETELECLQREIKEEINCTVKKTTPFQTFEGRTHDNAQSLRVTCYLVELEGEITPANEIEEHKWIDKNHKLKLTPIFTEQIIPELIKKGMIKWQTLTKLQE